ncbi:MAG: hypothetical protein NC301_09250 [Bacteroides sp.]|nr:hypothetical protein [Bacteroides sp.]
MARTIAEIKAQIAEAFISQDAIRAGYGLQSKQPFEKVFSPVSVESLMFYVVASCVWLVEKMFDNHKEEVDARIEALRPHTLRWYVSKTLAYMKDKDLVMTNGVVSADHYDTTGMTDAEIEAAQIVKYAVATEDNTHVTIKVATRGNNGQPKPLDEKDVAGLKYYLSQIKDAGVAVRVRNDPADDMRVELLVLYDPAVLTAEQVVEADGTVTAPDANGYSKIKLTKGGTDVIEKAVSDVISKLPFNGEYRNSDLMAVLQSIEGVRVADIVNVEVAVGGSGVYSKVLGYRRPDSGYYSLNKLTVKGRAYQIVE